MSFERSVLFVSPTAHFLRTVPPVIRQAGFRVRLAKTFESARTALLDAPDVLVTELKLGEYNGLQLALRGRTLGTVSIVIADSSFEREIERLGAVWVSPEEADGDKLERMITRLLQTTASSVSEYPWYNVEKCGDSAELQSETPTTTILH
jgi:DNA-binding response OmpR family regulator